MSSKNEINELKLRYRCSNCKNLESHHANNKKRKCEKCGTTLSEITEKDYRHYKNKLKKELEEEDKKETVSTKDKEGKGEIGYNNGKKCYVNFKKGKPDGKGILIDENKNEIEVEFVDGIMVKNNDKNL